MAESVMPPLDCEDWAIAFQAYAEYPILAFILAQHLDFVKVLIQHSPKGQEAAITGLERGIDALMRYTTFRDVGRTAYLLAVAGNLKPDDEAMVRQLGTKER
jgi:hypothetical protein